MKKMFLDPFKELRKAWLKKLEQELDISKIRFEPMTAKERKEAQKKAVIIEELWEEDNESSPLI